MLLDLPHSQFLSLRMWSLVLCQAAPLGLTCPGWSHCKGRFIKCPPCFLNGWSPCRQVPYSLGTPQVMMPEGQVRTQPHPRDSREPDPRPSESRELSPACAPVKPVAPHLAPPSERGCHSSPQLAPASRPSRSPGSLQHHRAGRRPPSRACTHAGPGAQPAGLGPAGSSRARPPPPVSSRAGLT